MNYKIGIGVVLLLQLAISGIVIFAGTGNGSFVGLGAMLFALIGIPTTAIINFSIIQGYRKDPKPSNIKLLIVISSILPALQLGLLFAQIAFDL